MGMRAQHMPQPRREPPASVLMLVTMNMAVVMSMPGIGTAALRVVHNVQDARKTLLQHLNHSGPGAPATSSLFLQDQICGIVAGGGTVMYGGYQRGQHQRPREGEGSRIAGVDNEHAEYGGAGAVTSVISQVPQGAGRAVAAGRCTVDHQREGDVLADPEADPEQAHARDQGGRGRHPDQDDHPGGRGQQPGNQQAGVTVPVTMAAGPPAAHHTPDGRATIAGTLATT